MGAIAARDRLAEAARDQKEYEPSAGRGGRRGSSDQVDKPARTDPSGGTGPCPAARQQGDRRGEGDGRHRGSRPGGSSEHPRRWLRAEENRGEREDHHQSRGDEADATNKAAAYAADPPGAKNSQLGRGRPGEQRGRGDPVLKLGRRQPLVLLDAKPAKQLNVRGWPTKAGGPEAQPFGRDRGQPDSAVDDLPIAFVRYAERDACRYLTKSPTSARKRPTR